MTLVLSLDGFGDSHMFLFDVLYILEKEIYCT